MKQKYFFLCLFFGLITAESCRNKKENKQIEPVSREITFDSLMISNEANQWFARALSDLNGDGLLDVAFINEAGLGGALGVMIGSLQDNWEIDWIAELAPNGGTFSCGDIEVGDIDGDGKTDILAPQNNGEWTDKPKEQTFYWYSYPEKKPHYIGKTDQYIKDVDLADLNNDGRPDLVGISFDGSYMIIFEQITPDKWRTARLLEAPNIHEGMDVGDIDGDGFIDITANGYWARNPNGNMDGAWKLQSIDSVWHNQSGDWSRNATKHFCADLDKDGRSEVFISHSERAGYPVAYYKLIDAGENLWEKYVVLNELPAAHTLQVGDMNNDGYLDVVTGVNRNRAVNIDVSAWPLIIMFAHESGQWIKNVVDMNSIYNGHIGDFEGDGDLDIFRLTSHNASKYELLINQLN
ncbi:MAG: VCBS repeat-containing protein [Cytophagales bacterium]|nr:VCBS repeat-containing protein [Cytophagales bacterium]